MLSSFGVTSEVGLERRVQAKVDEKGISLLDRQILVSLANGRSLIEQSEELGYTIDSIETYRIRLYRKIGVRNGAAAVAWGFKNKYLI